MDWIAAIILAIGIYFTGKYKWWGWLFSIVATIMWIWLGYVNEIYGMIALNVFLLGLNVVNCIKWFKNEKQSKIVKNGSIWIIKNINRKY